MHNTQKVTDTVYWVGANDRRINLFENIFPLENGVSYNSYLIRDEKNALMDTVEYPFAAQLLENLETLLEGKPLDYVVVTHVEPDHASALALLLEKYPEAKIVASAKAHQLIGQFFEADFSARFHEVKDGDTLPLGSHSLSFCAAPMVHWPEVMLAYDEKDKILFSADAFGTFGALNGNLFADEVDYEAIYLDEARRYYANIVGKYGLQVQNVLKKLAGVDVQYICPLHGPVWRENLAYLLGKYDFWSRYEPEQKGVLVAYGSMYGNTENAANLLASMLADRGITDIRLYDISKTHASVLVGEMFKYSHMVLAAPTYNMGIYLPMANLLHDMAALTVQNRRVALVGNGSWAPAGLDLMRKAVEELKNTELVGEPFLVRSALKKEQLPKLEALADAITESVKA